MKEKELVTFVGYVNTLTATLAKILGFIYTELSIAKACRQKP